MKKRVSVMALILAVIMILSCGCAKKTDNDTNVGGNESGGEVADETAVFKKSDAVAKKYGFATEEKSVRLGTVEEKKPLMIDKSKEMYYSNSMCRYVDDKKETYGRYYSVFDYYYSADKKEMMVYVNGTKYACAYSADYTRDESLPEKTRAELIGVTEEFLKSFLPFDILKNYTLISRDTKVDKEYDLYTFFYVYLAANCRTDDVIQVTVDGRGVVVSYSAFNLNKYEKFYDTITQEVVDAAKAKLQAEYDGLTLENMSNGEFCITANTSGTLYLGYSFKYDSEGKRMSETLLVKL